jgi:hypothetical protein
MSLEGYCVHSFRCQWICIEAYSGNEIITWKRLQLQREPILELVLETALRTKDANGTPNSLQLVWERWYQIVITEYDVINQYSIRYFKFNAEKITITL